MLPAPVTPDNKLGGVAKRQGNTGKVVVGPTILHGKFSFRYESKIEVVSGVFFTEPLSHVHCSAERIGRKCFYPSAGA